MTTNIKFRNVWSILIRNQNKQRLQNRTQTPRYWMKRLILHCIWSNKPLHLMCISTPNINFRNVGSILIRNQINQRLQNRNKRPSSWLMRSILHCIWSNKPMYIMCIVTPNINFRKVGSILVRNQNKQRLQNRIQTPNSWLMRSILHCIWSNKSLYIMWLVFQT